MVHKQIRAILSSIENESASLNQDQQKELVKRLFGIQAWIYRNKTNSVTPSELIVLQAIYNSEYQDGSQDEPDHPVWTECISEDCHGEGIAPKQFSGLVSSLTQKGMVDSDRHPTNKGRDESCIWLTKAGLAILAKHK